MLEFGAPLPSPPLPLKREAPAQRELPNSSCEKERKTANIGTRSNVCDSATALETTPPPARQKKKDKHENSK